MCNERRCLTVNHAGGWSVWSEVMRTYNSDPIELKRGAFFNCWGGVVMRYQTDGQINHVPWPKIPRISEEPSEKLNGKLCSGKEKSRERGGQSFGGYKPSKHNQVASVHKIEKRDGDDDDIECGSAAEDTSRSSCNGKKNTRSA